MVAGYDMGAFESTGQELGGNLIINGNFDSNTTGWTATRNAVLSSESGGQSGNYLKVLTGATNSPEAQETITIEASKKYQFSFYHKDINSSNDTPQYAIYDVSNSAYIQNYVNVSSAISSSSWVQQTNTFETPSGCTSILLILRHTGTANDNSYFGFDTVYVKKFLQSADLSDTYPLLVDVNNPVISQDLQTGTWNNSDLVGFTGASADGFTAVNTDASVGNDDNAYGDEISFTAGKTYKISFTNTVNSGSIGSILVGVTSGTTGSADNIMAYSLFTSTGNYSYTFTPSSTVTRRPSFRFVVNGTYNFTISNFEIIEYKGNTGVMTNQATSDLVYSSVLPDQSFLTGVNSAYNFIDLDGSDQNIVIADNDSLDLTNFTLSAWIRLTDVSDYRGIISKRSGTDVNYSFFVKTSEGKLGSFDGSAEINSSATVNDGNWHHVAQVHNSGTTTFYIDGSASGSGSQSFSTNAHAVLIGEAGVSQNDRFLGQIGQSAIWNKNLSSTEISAINTAGRHSNLLDSYSDNLVGYWAMSALDASTGLSDSISTIYDRSGNSNHGIPQNADAGDLASSPNAEPNGYAKGDTNRSTTIP